MGLYKLMGVKGYNKDFEIIELIIENSVGYNHVFRSGNTILLIAAQAKGVHEDYFKKYVNLGLDINNINTNGNSALYYAISAGNLKLTKLLIGLGADSQIKHQYYGGTLLHAAATSGDLDLFKFLLSLNFDFRELDYKKRPPLQRAVRSGSLLITKYIIEDLHCEVSSDSINSLVISAIKSHNPEILEYILKLQPNPDFFYKDGQGMNLLMHAAQHYTNYDDFTKLASLLPDSLLEDTDNEGKTPLHHALTANKFWYRQSKIFDYLIKNTKNFDLKDKTGKTPLIYAVSNKLFLLASALIKKGADLFAIDDQQRTLLHHAIGRYVEIPASIFDFLKRVLEKGLDIRAKDQDGNTPIFSVFTDLGDTEMIAETAKFLIQNGADINDKNNKNQNILHLLINKSNNPWLYPQERIKIALELKINPNIVDNDGHTPIQIAYLKLDRQVIELLKKHGAIIDRVSLMKSSEAAISDGKLDLVSFIFEDLQPTEEECKQLIPIYISSIEPLTKPNNDGKDNKWGDYENLVNEHMELKKCLYSTQDSIEPMGSNGMHLLESPTALDI